MLVVMVTALLQWMWAPVTVLADITGPLLEENIQHEMQLASVNPLL
jgi:hypothetical protein